jgi:sugar lactone lactonase YvrE
VSASGNLFIAEARSSVIRKVNTSGIINTVAGNGARGYSGDNGIATSAQLIWPNGIAVDIFGNFYIADSFTNRIRKVNTSGIITTVAGNGTSGYSGDEGPASGAQLNGPGGVAIDASGNLYIADAGNERVRKVSRSGIITTAAGNGVRGYSGDNGPATSAQLFNPRNLAVDTSGNIYIADNNNVIRKVNTSGIITTVAGTGAPGYSGDNGPASSAHLNGPEGMTVDASGNIYIADNFNNRIRKVNTGGIITTVAGNGTSGYSGDKGPASGAQLNGPVGVAIDASGNLYIADGGNDRIRKVSFHGADTER